MVIVVCFILKVLRPVRVTTPAICLKVTCEVLRNAIGISWNFLLQLSRCEQEPYQTLRSR
jgi:hypothetical protein